MRVFQSVPPSHFHSIIQTRIPSSTPSSSPSVYSSDTPTNVPSLTISLIPSTIPTDTPSLFLSSRVLKELYDSTGGTEWHNIWDFNTGQSYCNFYGITCDEFDKITRIMLASNNLRGSLPTELGILPLLTIIDLDLNDITGTIQSEQVTLLSLTYLDLWNNVLTGTLPAELCLTIYYDQFEISCFCVASTYLGGTPCN